MATASRNDRERSNLLRRHAITPVRRVNASMPLIGLCPAFPSACTCRHERCSRGYMVIEDDGAVLLNPILVLPRPRIRELQKHARRPVRDWPGVATIVMGHGS